MIDEREKIRMVTVYIFP